MRGEAVSAWRDVKLNKGVSVEEGGRRKQHVIQSSPKTLMGGRRRDCESQARDGTAATPSPRTSVGEGGG